MELAPRVIPLVNRGQRQEGECCSTCKSMTGTLRGLEALVSTEGYVHHARKEMKESAKSCPLCQLILPFCPLEPVIDKQVHIFAHLVRNRERENLEQIQHPWRGGKVHYFFVNPRALDHQLDAWPTFTIEGDTANQYVPMKSLSIPVINAEISQIIKSLISKCQQEHERCWSKTTPHLPARVIDVGVDSSSPRTSLYCSQPNEMAPYIALSYCWGGPQKITTTSENLEAHKRCLPQGLPKTIEDAIKVTRCLGFRYLWVDALCIIQDDDEDKISAIHGMGHIYNNATLTIAAASANSVNDGFLEDRPQSQMTRLPFAIDDTSCGNIWLNGRQHTQLPENALDSRGWALQESLLSCRIVYYSRNDLMWICQQRNWVPVNKTHNPYASWKIFVRLPNGFFSFPQIAVDTGVYRKKWCDIIEEYSRRRLSIPKDRLPALAGLAREFHARLNDSYIAGMWRKSLVEQLCWYQSRYRGAPRSITTYQSPGWSWISCEGGVQVTEIERVEAKVIDVQVDLADMHNPFGNVLSGRLTIETPVWPDGFIKLGGFAVLDKSDMDFYIERTQGNFEGIKTVILGYNSLGGPAGLHLLPTGDGAYMRVGSFDHRYLRHQEQEGFPRLFKREVFTII